MKILIASSEIHPFSKTGGLADMVGALAKTLPVFGNRVGVVTPLYAGLRKRFPKLKKLEWRMSLPLGARIVDAEVWTLDLGRRLTVYFVRQPEFFERAGIYGEQGGEYPDNGARFIFFSKCVAHLARYLPWQPELVHVHDWQSALVPLLIRHQQLEEGWWNAPRTCLTIHNLAYQGNFPPETFALTGLPENYFNLNAAEFYGNLGCLKAGIVFADIITTVSPRYAREIMTESFGCGLEGVLLRRQDQVFGILNGVDYSEWTTTKNPFLKHSFSAANIAGKAKCKRSLQLEVGLPTRADAPLFATISRLADQKGVDILLDALELTAGQYIQFILLGSGDPKLEEEFRELGRRFPEKFAVRIGYDHALSHRIESGADFFLMPSRYEPCGLNQMYSQRYGTIPIVRATGGLDDSVVDATEHKLSATGIKFTDFRAETLAEKIRDAMEIFSDAKLLKRYRVAGMKADFSWERTGEQYSRIYELATEN